MREQYNNDQEQPKVNNIKGYIMTLEPMERDKIIEDMKDYYGFDTESELAEFLGVTRQRVNQFKNMESVTIATRMISALLKELI